MGEEGKYQSKVSLKNDMESLICLVFGLLVSTSVSQASFASSDVSKTGLKRQILEEILAEIEQQELALQRQHQQQDQHQAQQRQLRQQIQHLLELELPQNNQLI